MVPFYTFTAKGMPKVMEKRWVIKEAPEKEKVKELAITLQMDEKLAYLLVQRGILDYENARRFFRPSLSDLHHPMLMQDMDKAVNRITRAIEQGENILVYGDYDVDGTTAVAVMYTFLSGFYDKVAYYIPDRYKEGYGISTTGIDFANDNGFSLIIALDCGIKSNDKVDYALEKNIDFIICDHHLPGEKIPAAAAVLDPKRKDCAYPYKELSGCGIGFKLCQALCHQLNRQPEEIFSLIDLAAISIAADIVPITGENRTLCYLGLEKINEKPSPGIAAILKVASKQPPLTVSDLVFIIAPRINAAGRMESGRNAVDLMISSDDHLAFESGKLLDSHNADRKNLDKEITREALQIISSDEKMMKAKTTVLWSENWHKGVIGIVASRLTETYYRPTILFTLSNGVLTGSARSVREFDVHEAISSCSEFLIQFGGHKYAAGITLHPENFDSFRNRFEEVVASTITEELLIPSVEIDEEIKLTDIKSNPAEDLPKFARILKQFGPFGPGNMNPVFLIRNVKDTGYVKIVGENHLKFTVFSDENPAIKIPCIGFGLGEYLPGITNGKIFDIACCLEENTWNDRTTVQLVVKDIKLH